MTDEFDRAQDLEMQFRERAISNQLSRHESETPDEDEDGNRYCLSCGVIIPPERIKAQKDAVRCIDCQTRKEH